MVEKINVKGLDKYITGKNKVKIKVGEVNFVVDKNYKILEKLGKGAYGQVVKAKDLQEKEEELQDCAIKKIDDIFEHVLYAKRSLRELKILRLLEHENVSLLYIINNMIDSMY